MMYAIRYAPSGYSFLPKSTQSILCWQSALSTHPSHSFLLCPLESPATSYPMAAAREQTMRIPQTKIPNVPIEPILKSQYGIYGDMVTLPQRQQMSVYQLSSGFAFMERHCSLTMPMNRNLHPQSHDRLNTMVGRPMVNVLIPSALMASLRIFMEMTNSPITPSDLAPDSIRILSPSLTLVLANKVGPITIPKIQKHEWFTITVKIYVSHFEYK